MSGTEPLEGKDDDMIAVTGFHAIELAAKLGYNLCKYSDPTEDERDDLSVDEARAVAEQDPSLLYLEHDGSHAMAVGYLQQRGSGYVELLDRDATGQHHTRTTCWLDEDGDLVHSHPTDPKRGPISAPVNGCYRIPTEDDYARDRERFESYASAADYQSMTAAMFVARLLRADPELARRMPATARKYKIMMKIDGIEIRRATAEEDKFNDDLPRLLIDGRYFRATIREAVYVARWCARYARFQARAR